MEKYRIQFKDMQQNAYEVKIGMDAWTGSVQRLTGAKSAFTVQLADDDFIYTPLRCSTATLRLLSGDVLTDLYSIDNHYARVRFLKNGALEWTGYVKPEQYTQPYVANTTEIGIDCVSAISTLEHVEYKKKTKKGFISAWELLRALIADAAGMYAAVYVPLHYKSAEGDTRNVLEHVMLCEENFDKRDELEVMGELMKFLNWTLYDIRGAVWLVDADWKGMYRKYDEGLTTYTEVARNEVLLQDVGYNGSDGNTLDVVRGYNKATVKSVNNVFEDVINNEMYDACEMIGAKSMIRGKHYLVKEFLKPKLWKVHSFDKDGNEVLPSAGTTTDENELFGAVLLREAACEGKKVDGTLRPDVEEYPWYDAIQMRYYGLDGLTPLPATDGRTVLEMRGATCLWMDCAIGISAMFRFCSTLDMDDSNQMDLNWTGTFGLRARLRAGDMYWNGTAWVPEKVEFRLPFRGEHIPLGNGWVDIDGNKGPDSKYGKNVRGYVVPLPNGVMGKLVFELLPLDYEQAGSPGALAGGIVLKDLQFTYDVNKGVNTEGEHGDRVYENVVNEAYMTECDEIAFEIGSYNNDGATYSKAMMDGAYMTAWWNGVTASMLRPEELMVTRIVNRYGVTKIKLSEDIKESAAVVPISVLTERTMAGKAFVMAGGEWDYEACRMRVIMQEDV